MKINKKSETTTKQLDQNYWTPQKMASALQKTTNFEVHPLVTHNLFDQFLDNSKNNMFCLDIPCFNWQSLTVTFDFDSSSHNISIH